MVMRLVQVLEEKSLFLRIIVHSGFDGNGESKLKKRILFNLKDVKYLPFNQAKYKAKNDLPLYRVVLQH